MYRTLCLSICLLSACVANEADDPTMPDLPSSAASNTGTGGGANSTSNSGAGGGSGPTAGGPASGTGGGAPSAGGGLAGPTVTLPIDGLIPASSIAVRRDVRGVTHVLSYKMYAYEVYYGRCTSNCGQKSSWVTITLPWSYAEPSASISPVGAIVIIDNRWGPVRVSGCTVDDCTRPGSWSSPAELYSANSRNQYGVAFQNNVAFDSSGAIHVVLSTFVSSSDQGISYATCNSQCGSPSSWTTTRLPGNFFSEWEHLQVGTGGVVGITTLDGVTLRYFECRGNCTDVSNWSQAAVATVLSNSKHDFAFEADKPRIAFLDTNQHMTLIGCDSGCGLSSNFTGVMWTGISYNAEPTIALAFDSGRTVLGFEGDTGAQVMGCSSSCLTTSGRWTSVIVDSTAIATQQSTLLPPICNPGETPLSGPVVGTDSDLRLAFDGPNVLAVHGAEDEYGCLGSQYGVHGINERVRYVSTPFPH